MLFLATYLVQGAPVTLLPLVAKCSVDRGTTGASLA